MVELKADNPSSKLRGQKVPGIVSFYLDLCHLKRLYRQGWLQRSVPRSQCESVADHSFAVTVLAWVLAEELYPELDVERVVRLALIHDLGEIDAGDLTPAHRVPEKTKSLKEREAILRVFGALGPGCKRYLDLWDEYEAGGSQEALFVRQVEKLEMALQAAAYELDGLGPMDEFFVSVDDFVEETRLRRILEQVLELRREESGE